MTSAVVVFLLVATVCVSSTVAIAPCSDVIIAGLSQHPECFTTGLPPVQKLEYSGSLATYLVYTKGEISPDVACVTGRQDDDHTYGTAYYLNKTSFSFSWNAVFYDNYVEETTESSGIKYRLYVIHNECGAYSYYRCIEEGSTGTGTHAAFVVAGCPYVNNTETLAVVAKAEKCFDKVGITNYLPIEPCDC